MQQISHESQYNFVRLIGEGGMGAVYEATLEGTEGFRKRTAIKTILQSASEDQEFVDMFIGEAKLVADLVHENIVQIYQLGRTQDGYFMAMEYINGMNLEEFVEKHKELGMRVPVEWSAFVISRVARGLEYAHSKCGMDGRLLGVVHRDVNPKNIMMRIDGVVKLGDFGIAKAAHFIASKEGEMLMGKWMYMSPEQASFLETDARSDIFSLGIVLHELLAGKPLFGDDDLYVVRDRLLNGEIPSPKEANPDVPDDLEKIVMKMLERDLDQRYQDAKTLSHDLEYHLYHKGYGPTNQTFGRYLTKLFPEIHTEHTLAGGSVKPAPPAYDPSDETAELPPSQ
jgi:serine/threonine protein kinase